MGILIAILSLIPGYNLPESPVKFADLIVHIGLYGTWMFVICAELKKQYSDGSQRYNIGLLLTVIVFGIIIEALQELFIPGRFGSVSDGLANAIGATMVYLLYRRFYYSSK